MAEHISSFDEDDGWPTVACSCGWATPPLPDMETAADVWGDHRAAFALTELTPQDLIAGLLATGYEPDHVMRVSETGWVLRHSLACRLSGDLFDCPHNEAAMRLTERPAPDGDWIVDVDDGEISIVRPAQVST